MKKYIKFIFIILILCTITLLYAEENAPPAAEEDDLTSTIENSIIENPFTIDEEPTDVTGDDSSAFIDDPFKVEDEDSTENTPNSSTGTSSTGDEDDMDSLFKDDMFEELDQDKQDTAPHEALLKTEGLVWGGKFSGAADSQWNWNILDPEGTDLFNPSDISIDPKAGADIYFNARPEKDFRVYGKLKIQSGKESAGFSNLMGFTLTQDAQGNFVFGPSTPQNNTATTPDDPNVDGDTGQTTPTDTDADSSQVNTDPDYNSDDAGLPQYPAEEKKKEEAEAEEAKQNPGKLVLSVSVFELFADFNWNDLLFFRFGKHTIKWGIGYFWSPADVLNLTPIDTENPTADREGPLSLKTHFPFDVHNAYLYLIANQASEPLDIAIAPKVEFVIGNAEIGAGAFYQRDLAPRFVSTVKTSLADFDLFGEAVVSYGSDKVFVKKSRDQTKADESLSDGLDVVLDTYEDKTSLFLSATAGLLYANTNLNFNVMAQYFFNGEGYDNSDLLSSAYYLSRNTNANGLYIQNEADKPDGYEDPPALGVTDLTNFGKHYAAFSLMFTKLFGIEDLEFSLFMLANLCDFSGIITPAISYKFFNKFNLNLSLRTTFGEEGDEFTNPASLAQSITGSNNEDTYKGPTVALALTLTMGDGSF